ncbi:MAG: L,D-transpeptidase/peptidoglycan binding protein [Roseburia sp.]|nr:L,D-transpeptidase/peptidoglycan binding protein [Roseburia sp.]
MTQIKSQKRHRARNGILIFFGILILAYIAAAVYFHYHFFPNTTLNGVNVSGKTSEAAESAIRQEIDTFVLHMTTRNPSGDEEITGESIGLAPRFQGEVNAHINSQNVLAWGVQIFQDQKLKMDTVVEFDSDALKGQIKNLECMKKENQEAPVNAYVSDYGANGYEIIPEEQGCLINESVFQMALEDAVKTLQDEFDLEEAGCYKTPDITAESAQLTTLADTLNRYTGAAITYDLGNEKEVLDGSLISQWLQINGSSVTIDEEAVTEYVDSLASSHNTVFRGHTLKTSYGNSVDIKEGDYGWKVDKEGEKEQILKDIKAGSPVTREIVYAQRANSHEDNDYGDTYVEINLAKQHLFFYKNGNLVVESDFVSGNQSKRYDTPTGVYGITYKQRDAVLKGENYATPVSYWMPFCNNVGMHDANWRGSFGGKIYKTSGSHGCVNLPPSAAKTIFENIEEGDPVLVYKYPEEEYGTAPPENPTDAPGVTALINNIGAVSLANEAAVAQARLSYNALPPEEQAQVPNYDVLCAAEAQLDVLRAQQPQ